MSGKYSEPAEGIHYEIYWMLEGEVLPTRKLDAFLHQREKVSKVIEETGRESYLIYRKMTMAVIELSLVINYFLLRLVNGN